MILSHEVSKALAYAGHLSTALNNVLAYDPDTIMEDPKIAPLLAILSELADNPMVEIATDLATPDD